MTVEKEVSKKDYEERLLGLADEVFKTMADEQLQELADYHAQKGQVPESILDLLKERESPGRDEDDR